MSLGTVLVIVPDLASVGSLAHLAVQRRLGLLSLEWPWVGRAPIGDPPRHRPNLEWRSDVLRSSQADAQFTCRRHADGRPALGFEVELKVKT